MTMLSFVNQVLAISVILSQIFIAVSAIYLLFFRKEKNNISDFIGKHGLRFAFLISFIATANSFFYSQIVGFPPCDLCWYQRIFIYPEVILLGMALIKKDSKIIDYVLALSLVGWLISLYHNYIYYYNSGLNVFCQLGGSNVSCVKRYVFEFGYVTIPIMALTAFSLIIIFLVFYRMYIKKSVPS